MMSCPTSPALLEHSEQFHMLKCDRITIVSENDTMSNPSLPSPETHVECSHLFESDRSTTAIQDITNHRPKPPAVGTHSEHLHLFKKHRKHSVNNPPPIGFGSIENSRLSRSNGPQMNKLWAWWKESTLLVASSGIVITIISMLAAYGGKPLPNWTLGLNLNTVVAVLATSLRSSLVMVVEEILSQAKWTWQYRLHPVIDLASFDDASRGPLGSLALWFKVTMSDRKPYFTRQTVSVIFASTVTILSLAVGSFTQQAIKTIPCEIALENVTAALPLTYGTLQSTTNRFLLANGEVSAEAKGRVFRAFAGINNDRSTLVQGCTTGSCTFPEVAPGVTHITSGFCSKCLDTTNSIFEKPGSTGYLFSPSGLFAGPIGHPIWYQSLNTGVGEMSYWATDHMKNMTWSDKNMYSHPDISSAWKSSVAKLDVLTLTTAGCKWSDLDGQLRNRLGDILYSYDCSYPLDRNFTAPSNDTMWKRYLRWNVVSASCVLYPCVKKLKASVESGRLKEEVVEEAPLHPFSGSTPLKTPCLIDGIRYDKQKFSLVPAAGALNGSERLKQQCYYSLPDNIAKSMAGGWFSDLTLGNCSMYSKPTDRPSVRSSAWCNDRNQTRDAWWLSGLYNSGNATFDTVSALMDDVATAFTDGMRLASIADDGLNENNTVHGTVWKGSICAEFSWRWLLFPIALVSLAIVSLVLMILSTAFSKDHIPVWKSSILPFLYFGNNNMHTMLLEEMEKAAKKDEVALQRDEVGRWQLVPGYERRDDESG